MAKPRLFDRPRLPTIQQLQTQQNPDAPLAAEAAFIGEVCGSLSTAAGFVFVIAPVLYVAKAIPLESYLIVAILAFLGFGLALVAQSIRVGRITVGVNDPGDLAYMLRRLRAKERRAFLASGFVGLALAGLVVTVVIGAY